MKSILFLSVFLVINAFCCEEEEEVGKICPAVYTAACQEEVPTGEMCDAYFIRWFYDEGTKTCQRVEYSGCNERGFASPEECEACKCG